MKYDEEQARKIAEAQELIRVSAINLAELQRLDAIAQEGKRKDEIAKAKEKKRNITIAIFSAIVIIAIIIGSVTIAKHVRITN